MSSKGAKYITIAIIIFTISIGVLSAFYDLFSAPSNAVKIETSQGAIMAQSFEVNTEKEIFAPAVEVDRAFLAFELPNLNEEQQNITARGKGQSVLHFWATWCAPCILELPELIREAQDSDKRFIIISVDDELSSIARFRNRLIKANGDLDFDAKNIIWLQDKGMKVMKDLYGVKKLPESFLADDARAKLIKHFAGPVDWKNADF